MKIIRKMAYLLVILCFTRVLAQADTCVSYVQQALAAVDEACAAIGRNQACYGNVALSATPREGVGDFTFEQAGDLANIADLQTLRLRQLDLEANVWGVALMKLQANLPDTLPGQNVTFVLFGDVEIENAVEPGETLPTTEVTSNGGINIRKGPSTSFAVIGSLANGETATANGRSSDGSWLRIQVPDADALGWVSADLVTADDSSGLSVVEAGDAEVPFTPMQAFYFNTGSSETGCTEAPASGILIQTPAGAGEITLRANDVDIKLGSTAYLQAQPSDVMTISVVEGRGQITAEGETVIVPAGAKVDIPIDENLNADGAPGEPEPYDPSTVQALPIVVLPEDIEIAPPVSEEDLIIEQQDAGTDFGGAAPMPGGFDPSMFGGMDAAAFCPLMTQAMADAGMSIGEYISLVEGSMGMMPAELQGQFTQFLNLLRQC